MLPQVKTQSAKVFRGGGAAAPAPATVLSITQSASGESSVEVQFSRRITVAELTKLRILIDAGGSGVYYAASVDDASFNPLIVFTSDGGFDSVLIGDDAFLFSRVATVLGANMPLSEA